MGLSVPGSVAGYQNAMTNPALGASPATVQNTQPYNQECVIAAGTVTAITINRKSQSLSTGLVGGLVTLSPGDSVSITYTVAPTVTLIPR